jgi:hypothetical protein
MPLFYFDVRKDEDLAADTEGTMLEDLGAARREAGLRLAEMVRETLPCDGRCKAMILIRNEHREPMLRAAFAAVIEPA